MRGRDRFRNTLACEEVDRPPVWLMRQAGRSLPEYRALRAEHDFLTVMKTPELAAEVTLQPLRRFGMDVAVVFSDILVVPEAMGQTLSFGAGHGPKLAPPIDTGSLELRPIDPARDIPALGATLDLVRAEVGDDHGVVGFAGAPFTLLCYMCGTIGKDPATAAKKLMMTDPERGHALLERITDAVVALLRYQRAHDVDAVQLFDTHAGALSTADHAAWCQPYNQRVADAMRADGTPLILYAREAAHLVDALVDTGAAGLSVDWRTDLVALARRLDGDGPATVALQGNLDPACLYGPPEQVRARVRELHDALGGRRGHVFNLGHGLLPSTPLEGIAAFVDAVKELG